MKASHEGKFLTSTTSEPAFISRGFTYWKEVTSTVTKHQSSDCHLEDNEAITMLLNVVLGDIGEVVSMKLKEEKAVN